VAPSWRPARCIPLLVTHRPVFMVFSSAEDLVKARGLAAEWEQRFRAWPSVWALSELELLEAALPEIELARLFVAAEERNPIASAGVPSYLTHVGYAGPTASPYYNVRRHEILEPFVRALAP
jgi:hypothetical protein